MLAFASLPTFLLDWVNLLFRWAHLVVGIGWIGTSFYFIALDLGLRNRREAEGVAGTAWEVHGGGFYRVEKYMTAPKELPAELTWFRWEAYLTWVTGFVLLVVQYYWRADVFLIQPSVLALLPGQAVVISLISLALGVFIYHRICRSEIGAHGPFLAVVVYALIVLAAYFYARTFSGRGALIHTGVLIGSIMSFNVLAVIIPNQRKIVAALIGGHTPDPALGKEAKQRSVHNNYLTLPVLLLMVSNHYPELTGTEHNWLAVAAIVAAGAAVRHFINRHDAGDPFARIGWTLPVAAGAVAAAMYLTAPRIDPSLAGLAVSEGEALAIVGKHCVMCHAARPTHEGFDAAPKNVVLNSVAEIRRHGEAIVAQAVNGDTMPLGNETAMTYEERRKLGAFLLNDAN
jgi:uncharacterized membrane protein